MTLEELKRKNAEEAAAQQAAQPGEAAEPEALAEGTEPEPVGEDPEGAGEDPEVKEVPAWLAAGEQTPDGAQVPVKTHVAMKQKLKGRLSEQKSEIAQLREEVQQLKGTGAPQQVQAPAQMGQPMPKADDFYDKPDPDGAYQAALQQWMDNRMEQRLQTQLQTQQQQQQVQNHQSRINTALDQHYDRAAQIVNEGLLTAEEYQTADTLLRQSVEAIAPGNGDTFTDALLGRIGEGSEKVVVSLSRNPSSMTAFQQALREDPTGISAATYLGELRGKFSSMQKRVSQTPRPGSPAKGDAPPDGGSDHRQYKAAHKSGARQKAFDIKRAAKKRGVDVSKW